MNRILLAAAVLGFLSVVIGAVSDHGPLDALDAAMQASLATAIRYHQFGALITCVLGIGLMTGPSERTGRRLTLAGWLFVAGTVLFSFSIYAAAVTGVDALTAITPVGGVTLMAAWLALARAAMPAPDDRA